MADPKHPRVHFIGICGKAMGPIAAALARAGWPVTGSDEDAYPPMSDYLAAEGLDILPPDADSQALERAEVCVVGKRVPDTHPELDRVLATGKRYLSFPAFLREHFLANSRNAVVAGGVGKTTTTALLTWILEYAGAKPDYLIGGIARDLPHPARFAGSGVAVLEGDEYASCFDDPLPKFRHYAAQVAIVTNLLDDHPDLFATREDMLAVFADWIRTLPRTGCLVLPDDDPDALRLRRLAPCETRIVGFSDAADHPITDLHLSETGSRFRFVGTEVALPMCGRMNVRNAAMAMVAAQHLKIEPAIAAEALRVFRGIENRQQIRQLGSCTLVSDKACHPASIRGLFQAVRQQYPGRRLVSVIQPRGTGGRHWVYQRELPDALATADLVILARPYEHKPRPGQTWPGGPFSLQQLADDLKTRATPLHIAEDAGQCRTILQKTLLPQDVIVLSLPEQAVPLKNAILDALSAE